MKAPLAPRKPSVRELHGDTVVDEYAWMRSPSDPVLREYLTAERAHYDAHTTRLKQFADKLAAEAASRIPKGDEYSVAWQLDGFTYRTRIPHGEENEQLLRSSPGHEEQVLLDENRLAEPTGFIELGAREPSPDGMLLAWSADTTGAEFYELRIRDIRSGEDLPEVIPGTYTGVAWSADSKHLFYLVPDDSHRPYQVWRHELGSAADADVLVYEEGDQQFDLTLDGSRSGQLVIVTAASRETTEVWVLDAERPLDPPVSVASRERGVEYRVDHARDGDLYVVTDSAEEEFTLMRGRLGESWSQVDCPAIAPARQDTRLLRCDVLAEHLVLTVRRGGSPMIVITDHDGGNPREIAPQLTAGSIRVEHADDYDLPWIIVAEESLIEPTSWHELELTSGERKLLKRMDVPGYDPSRYVTERLMAPAGDGTDIPVTVARLASTALDGSAPCLLYGYGAYEATIDPEFERGLPSLLDRGVVYGVAHIRGGGEFGRAWWQQGRLQTKRNTFTDYLAVADWLAGVDGTPLVDGSRIVTRGASAGGLLQGAVYSMRPDRWRAVVAEVPFVDVVNTMLDPSIPLTANEWDEWGDPRRPEDYDWMRSYSPYENPPAGPRPPLLVTGAVNDPRVSIHEPAKWVASLRATDDSQGSLLLFRAELGVGAHSGPSGRDSKLRYEAEIEAFILDAMGITE
jgi:oligopeptidase B